MVTAKTTDGTLIIGLTRKNIERMMSGDPVYMRPGVHSVESPILIMFGETEQAIAEQLAPGRTMPVTQTEGTGS